MFRFPYRRALVQPSAAATSAQPGFFVRLIRFLTGKSPTTQLAGISPTENPPRPFVSIRVKGPVAGRRLKSALLDTASQDTLFPMELAEPLGIILGAVRTAVRWRGKRHWVEFHTVEMELPQDPGGVRVGTARGP
jgi:hypothetical protein